MLEKAQAMYHRFLTLFLTLVLSALVLTSYAQTRISGSGRVKSRTEEGNRTYRISRDLREEMERISTQRQSNRLSQPRSFIIQTEGAIGTEHLNKLRAAGAQINRLYNRVNLVSVRLPLDHAVSLANDGAFAFVSSDRKVQALGHLEETTGAKQVRSLISQLNQLPLDGRGIGVAVLDSGIDENHALIGGGRVIYRQDFTGQEDYRDISGHGTHVASLIAGNSTFAGGAYAGLAPGANLINLKVLDASGRGTSSALLAALDWCITNKDAYNIRVINMSLGSLALDSYLTDPLCLAVRRAHDAGIVVVCAAGNLGKTGNGRKIYGAIHSPGIDPSVITVGAANTFGTDERSDDKIASYSSRGPTRGYKIDENGVKRYDNLIKPDLVAPGNKLVGACAQNSAYSQNHPELKVGNATNTDEQLLSLSGTS
ncbi:MAG TPA: S8 family serine peptidase, partial [Blastocatellia bacterium]|nr:S8 family serine peptidase [Blastocatellia bacterium]